MSQRTPKSSLFKLAGLENATRSSSRPKSLTADAQTITDVCSGEELPEVEIISLLEEQIPKYKLRADTLTSFAGYENQDWYIPSPALRPEELDTPLTPEQIRETLNYFRVCYGLRLARNIITSKIYYIEVLRNILWLNPGHFKNYNCKWPKNKQTK